MSAIQIQMERGIEANTTFCNVIERSKQLHFVAVDRDRSSLSTTLVYFMINDIFLIPSVFMDEINHVNEFRGFHQRVQDECRFLMRPKVGLPERKQTGRLWG